MHSIVSCTLLYYFCCILPFFFFFCFLCNVVLLFLGELAKLRKTTISSVMSVGPSVCPHGTTRLPLDGFSLNLIFEYFRKTVEKIQAPLNRARITGTLHDNHWKFLAISRSVLLIMRNISDKSCRGNQSTHFMFSSFFFSRKSCCL